MDFGPPASVPHWRIFFGLCNLCAGHLHHQRIDGAIAFEGFRLLNTKMRELPSRLLSGAAAEVAMLLGYFLFEGFLYGFVPALVNIPANAVQGIAGLIIGTTLIKLLKNIR